MTRSLAFRFAIPLAMVAVCTVGAQQKPTELGFFISSAGSGKGADLGGLDGTLATGATNLTCSDWTSASDGSGSAQVGHHDRQGGGQNPTSWNSAHASRGCSQTNLQGTGGDGLFYCFAAK